MEVTINNMEEVIKFDSWMFKLRNKYYFDTEKMNKAYVIIEENCNSKQNSEQ